jgi:hypothetical protein
VLLVTAGQVAIEYDENEYEEEDEIQSLSDQNGKAIADDAITEQSLCLTQLLADADRGSLDRDSQDSDLPTPQEGRVIGFAPERDFRRRLSDAGAPIRNEWQFADKVLEKVDAEIHFDFASDDHAGDSKIIPMEDAPCVFGETSLWYSTNIENGFSARSVNYTELLRIPTSTLTSLAKQDPRVKTRFNAYRRAVMHFDSLE